MNNIFEPILDKDEQVIKTFKPCKAKMFTSVTIASFFCWIWLFIPEFILLAFNEEVTALKSNWWVAIIVVIATAIVVFGITLLLCYLDYKNTYYAYTNKRIIIRRGIFGVDYKSLDMSMIGAVTVNVSLLDKLLHKNTGTITYGSMASPMGGQSGPMFRFSNVKAPYETYKEIKGVIDEFKNKKETKKED